MLSDTLKALDEAHEVIKLARSTPCFCGAGSRRHIIDCDGCLSMIIAAALMEHRKKEN